MTHFHAVVNMPGYLPVAEPLVFRYEGNARAYLRREEQQDRRDGIKGYVYDCIGPCACEES